MSAERGQAVRRELVLRAPVEQVWTALTSADRLAEWFGASVELEARRGGAVHARWPDGTIRRGVVEAAERSHRLAFRWRPMPSGEERFEVGRVSRVEFVLESIAEGTRLTVVEEPGVVPGEALEGASA